MKTTPRWLRAAIAAAAEDIPPPPYVRTKPVPRSAEARRNAARG